MAERFVKKLIAPSFVIAVLSSLFFYELKYLISRLFFNKDHILIIGILSAPENFQKRLSIRKTWLQLISEISGSSYFIIGNEFCEVPLIDRPDPYSCISQPFILPSNATIETEYSTVENANNVAVAATLPSYKGFGFYVRSQIRVRKLGIMKNLMMLFNSVVQVKLISALTGSTLASVTFEPLHPNDTAPDILLKFIKPVTLHDNSEAIVKIHAKDLNHILLPNCGLSSWSDGPRVISYVTLWPTDSALPVPFTPKSCSYVSMKYTVEDVGKIKLFMKNMYWRFKQWHLHNKKLSVKLRNESKIYNDIMFLDVVDVYKNISLKLINFYKRIFNTEYFHYILKTDDDSFIDLLRIHNQLQMINKEFDDKLGKIISKPGVPKFWWWSFFRESWRVQHSGKWRESQYRSVSYPSFPCGGGYVINKGVVDYIVANEHNLNHFQGEDVSMGIWLSSLPVVQYRTPNTIPSNNSHGLQKKVMTMFRRESSGVKFVTRNKLAQDVCEWTCDSGKTTKLPACNKVQMSVHSMYDAWNEYTSNGFV